MTGTRVASFGPTGARAAALALLAVALSACYVPRETTETIPNDYRLRHPIAIQEGSRKMVVLIGTRRGTLTPTQRAEVMNFARTWRHEATGGVLVEVPADTPNHKAASEALQEVRALLAAAEVPPRAVRVVSYQAGDAGTLAPIKLAYPKIVADAAS